MTTLHQVLHALQEYVQDHAVKLLTGLILMAFGWWLGHRRAKADWTKQEFLDRLNVSLSTFENGRLQIRTLSEKHCEEVFLNSEAAATVKKLAKKTTATDPIVPIPREEIWFYLNSVLNDLSEQFAAGLLKKDMGGTVESATYLIALTCECAGELRTRKVRAMVVRKTVLLSLPPEPPKLEQSHHTTRWATLQFLAAEYGRNPWRFLEVELSVA